MMILGGQGVSKADNEGVPDIVIGYLRRVETARKPLRREGTAQKTLMALEYHYLLLEVCRYPLL